MSEDFHMRSQMRTGEDMVGFAKRIKESSAGDMIHNCTLVESNMGNAHLEIWWVPLTAQPWRPELPEQCQGKRHRVGQSTSRGFSEVQIPDWRRKYQWSPGWFDIDVSFILLPTWPKHKRSKWGNGRRKSQPAERLAGEHAAFWKGNALLFVGSELRDGQHSDNYQQITNWGCRRPGAVWF